MPFAGNNGEMMILFAETYSNRKATSCPSGVKKHEAENLLKTKERKRRFL